MPLKVSHHGLRSFAAITFLMLTSALSVRAQAKKIDQFGAINAEDAMARLDMFANEIKSHPELRGIIVANNTTSYQIPRGTFLRRAHGYLEYLVKSRGVDSNRIRVAEGERQRQLSFELWTLPANQLSTISEEASAREPSSPQLFDRLGIGPPNQCVGQLPIELSKLEDGLRIFGDALQRHSRARAWIVVNPRTKETRAVTERLINASRQSLAKQGIKPERILTAIGPSRSPSCGEVRLWIVPGNSTKADEAGYNSQMLTEAESAKYTLRRVEFSGNQNLRDETLRKQLGQREGDLFSRSRLEVGFKNLNQLASVYPVTLADVDVRLDREEKLIDLTVHFRERRRP